MNSNSKSSVDTELQLPFGYRFHPTDVELLDFYLIPKLNGDPISPQLIMDLDIYLYDPDQLPFNVFKYGREHEAYFFTKTVSPQEYNLSRRTPNGYWKISKENIPISRGNEIIGFKNKFVFYNDNNPLGDKTMWKMIEYNSALNIATSKKTENLAICKVVLMVKDEENFIEEGGIELSNEESSNEG